MFTLSLTRKSPRKEALNPSANRLWLSKHQLVGVPPQLPDVAAESLPDRQPRVLRKVMGEQIDVAVIVVQFVICNRGGYFRCHDADVVAVLLDSRLAAIEPGEHQVVEHQARVPERDVAAHDRMLERRDRHREDATFAQIGKHLAEEEIHVQLMFQHVREPEAIEGPVEFVPQVVGHDYTVRQADDVDACGPFACRPKAIEMPPRSAADVENRCEVVLGQELFQRFSRHERFGLVSVARGHYVTSWQLKTPAARATPWAASPVSSARRRRSPAARRLPPGRSSRRFAGARSADCWPALLQPASATAAESRRRATDAKGCD